MIKTDLKVRNLCREFDICSLPHRDFSTSVTKLLSFLYLCYKIKVKWTLIQITEFMNETSMKIMQSYLYR